MCEREHVEDITPGKVCVIWNCCSLSPSYSVSFCPALPEESDIISVLRTLGVDWPAVSVSWTNEEREEKMRNALENCAYREREEDRWKRGSRGEEMVGGDVEMREELRINLKRVMEEVELHGYDPSLGICIGEGNCVLIYK